MLRFRLGSIPVEVYPSHLAFSALMAFFFKPEPGSGESGWPDRILAVPDDPAYARTLAVFVVLWMAIIFVSVLVHELGHALVSRAFGYRPSIQILFMGGNTNPNAPGPIPWWKDILLTLAGPGFGLLLAIASYLGWKEAGSEGEAEALGYGLRHLFMANVFWAVLNLIPVTPLDGGRIAQALFLRLFGRLGFLVTQLLALAVAGAVAWWALQSKLFFVLIFFVSYAFRAVSLIGAYLRGEVMRETPSHPAELALISATGHFREGKLTEAREVLEAALRTEMPLSVYAQAHHLLGWISLKEGKGRAALDHFSQVQGRPIEKQALAAAFSLVGDDGRALPLWEAAFRENGNATVLHEWAGALLRLGRVEEAERLQGVDMGAAFACAERVSFIRGAFADAARLGLLGVERFPSSERAYDTACALARAGDPDQAVLLLEKASALGFSDRRYAESDDDLASLREHPGFRRWLSNLGKNAPSPRGGT